MARIPVGHIYLYGKFYDTSEETVPGNGHYDVMIYKDSNLNGSVRTLGSLEGFFITNDPLKTNGASVVRRDQIGEFELKHRGRFIPFNENQ